MAISFRRVPITCAGCGALPEERLWQVKHRCLCNSCLRKNVSLAEALEKFPDRREEIKRIYEQEQ